MYKLDRVKTPQHKTAEIQVWKSHKSPGKERDSIGSATAMHLLALALFLHISLPSFFFSLFFGGAGVTKLAHRFSISKPSKVCNYRLIIIIIYTQIYVTLILLRNFCPPLSSVTFVACRCSAVQSPALCYHLNCEI